MAGGTAGTAATVHVEAREERGVEVGRLVVDGHAGPEGGEWEQQCDQSYADGSGFGECAADLLVHVLEDGEDRCGGLAEPVMREGRGSAQGTTMVQPPIDARILTPDHCFQPCFRR